MDLNDDINCVGLEGRRNEFRKYLEATGATEKLTTAMMKLYQETDRPEDALHYITNYLTKFCGDTDAALELKEEIKRIIAEKEKVELDLKVAQSQIRKTPSETNSVLVTLLKILHDNECATCLLKEFLTEDVFLELKGMRTDLRGSLLDNIQCGLTHPDAEIGVYASDQYAYDTFSLLFKPLLEEFHEFEVDGEDSSADDHPELDWGNPEELEDLDSEGLFIKSICITVGRALNNVPFMPIIKLDELKEAAEKLQKIFTEITDEDYIGKYHDLICIEEDQKKQWIEEGILFPNEDKYLKAAENYRFWPIGRGLFLNEKKNFRAWINEEEHLQIAVFETGGNLRDVYQRLVKAFDLIKSVEFARHTRWGFLAHNLKNIGNTIRITVKAKLPQLSLPDNKEKLDTFADKHNIAFKDLGLGLMELTNKKRLGFTEFTTAKDFQTGIAELINIEKCL